MNLVFTYSILAVAQISIYFYLKNSIKNLNFLQYIGYSKSTKNKGAQITEQPINNLPEPVKSANDSKSKTQIVLNKSLAHLEFISQFEMYLEDKNHKNFSIEFLQEFEKIKIEAQLNILNITTSLKEAA
jgi:hypothetical protein